MWGSCSLACRPLADPALLQSLAQPAQTKLVLLVLDGLGGMPRAAGGPTELEAASTPNLDRLAAEGQAGLSQPIGLGITPGSGPGHLALFGYDPVASNIGRGALSALGLGLRLDAGDLGVRLNFCTLDDQGNVADRRAGRIETRANQELVAKLNELEVAGVELEFATESQHRAVLIIRGAYLSPAVQETDPQAVGVPPLEPEPLTATAQHTSAVLRLVSEAVRDCIGRESPANFVLMRGYAGLPELQGLNSLYGLQPVCLATYPMYKGLARVAGMAVVDGLDTADEQMAAVAEVWEEYDYFFIHHKAPDARGEDGDFDAKAAAIEELDRRLPALLELGPDVLVVTGDHSTPSLLRQHSWHPVPCLFWGGCVLPDTVESFGERACGQGSLGVFPAQSIMGLMLAHGGRLQKFGA
ncbi:MAG: 2,3-bisphosphoglycerate-independent phosphoglycerate mutase [Chloroflexota bacterium]|nr:2,3-bisphosphoglycerate-independent phosphoglycerate mutase [Chloroflexota bacterium]